MGNWSGGYLDTTLSVSLSGPVRIYDLAVALRAGMPRHPLHPPFAFAMAKRHSQGGHGEGVSSAMELLAMGAHVGSHVDAFGHVAKDGRVFEDRDVLAGENASTGLTVGGIEETPPLIGPGHLVDAEKLFGRFPTPADSLGPAEFESWFAGRTPPGPGSIVLVRTGWMRFWPDSEAYIGLSTGLPGVNLAGARWLSDRGIIATGSDTMNLRAQAGRPDHQPARAHPQSQGEGHSDHGVAGPGEPRCRRRRGLHLRGRAAARGGGNRFPDPAAGHRPPARCEAGMTVTLTPQDIQAILSALEGSNWDSAVVTVDDVTISVARNGVALPAPGQAAPAPAPGPAPAPAPAAAAVPTPGPAAGHVPDASEIVVTAPSVGVFWRSPQPGAPPFVEVGAAVAKGDTVCIVEVMKLMSNVAAPASGVVTAIHVDNAAAVEFGSALISIRPSGD